LLVHLDQGGERIGAVAHAVGALGGGEGDGDVRPGGGGGGQGGDRALHLGRRLRGPLLGTVHAGIDDLVARQVDAPERLGAQQAHGAGQVDPAEHGRRGRRGDGLVRSFRLVRAGGEQKQDGGGKNGSHGRLHGREPATSARPWAGSSGQGWPTLADAAAISRLPAGAAGLL